MKAWIGADLMRQIEAELLQGGPQSSGLTITLTSDFQTEVPIPIYSKN